MFLVKKGTNVLLETIQIINYILISKWYCIDLSSVNEQNYHIIIEVEGS